MRAVITSKNIDLVKAKLPVTERGKIEQDDYKSQIIKYIPSEVVALYITAIGLVSSVKTEIPFELITWIIFIIASIGTIFLIWYNQKFFDWKTIIISTIAFVIWVFTLGGPFASLSWYHPIYGSLLLLFYTFFIPKLVGL